MKKEDFKSIIKNNKDDAERAYIKLKSGNTVKLTQPKHYEVIDKGEDLILLKKTRKVLLTSRTHKKFVQPSEVEEITFNNM
jgi:hypothetical protein